MKKIIVVFFVASALFSTVVAGILIYSLIHLPKLENVQDYRPAIGSRVLSREGKVIGEFFDTERRYVLPTEEIPTWVIDSFVSAEDGSFFQHSGIDYFGIARAFFANLRAGRVVQGGSTITQQMAKSLLLTSERSYTRKVREVLLAYKIEKNFTKLQILHLYLNQIYFGQRAYGVEAASRTYYHKSVKNISVAEAALLAGLVQAPSKYSPSKNPTRSRERQLYVLRRMFELGKIKEAQYKDAVVEEIRIYPEENLNQQIAPYFVEHVRQLLVEKYGTDVVYEKGLTIETSADYDLSKTAQKAVKANLENLDKRQGYRGVIAHVTTDAAIKEEVKKERWEVINKYFGYTLLPLEPPKEHFDDMMWADYTLAREKLRDPSLADENKLLLPDHRYRALVTRLDGDGKAATVLIGTIRAQLLLTHMRWAKKIKSAETANGAQISHVNETLSIGDVIGVKTVPEQNGKNSSAQIGKTVPGQAGKIEEPLLVSLEQEPLVQGALLSMEASSGSVLAMVGGYDYAKSEYNRALQGERQPGSSFKPLLYSAAIDKGFTPSSIIVDSPVIFENQGGANLKWIPENNSEKFYGDTTLRTAIINSRNVPAVKVLQEIGVSYFVNYLKAVGLQGELNPDLSLALGSKGLSLLELTKIYSLFPRLGVRIEPIFILKVTDREGKVLQQYSFKEFQNEMAAKWLKMKEAINSATNTTLSTTTAVNTDKTKTDSSETPEQQEEKKRLSNKAPVFDDPLRALDEKTAFVMENLLQEVVQYGTGVGAKVLKRKLGGKTGTTNEFVDAWFMGFSPEVITGVWTGFDSPRTLGSGEVGGRAALPAWVDYMAAALEKFKQDDFSVPKGIVFVRIDPKTGNLAGPGGAGVKEAFIEGTEPSNEKRNSQAPDSNNFFREDL